MTILGIIMTVLFSIISLFLILIIMIQDDQGEGLGGIFGGGSQSTFGSSSGNVLTRFTSILGALFIVLAFGLAWVNRTQSEENLIKAARQESAQQESAEWWVVPEDE